MCAVVVVKRRIRRQVRRIVNVGGATLRLQWKLQGVRARMEALIQGVAEKCLEIVKVSDH